MYAYPECAFINRILFAGYMVSEILDILEGVGAASLTRKEI